MKNAFFNQISKSIKHLAIGGFFLLIGLNLVTADHIPIAHNDIIDTQIFVYAGDSQVLGSLFPSCGADNPNPVDLINCLKEVVTYGFFVGLGIFFVRMAYLIVISSTQAGGANTFKMVKTSISDLFVGVVLIGMPITIMTLINPATGGLYLEYFGEFNFGPEAVLISPMPGTSSCPEFVTCIEACVMRKTGDSKLNCVTDCKEAVVFKDCSKCFEFVNEEGVGTDSAEFTSCVDEIQKD